MKKARRYTVIGYTVVLAMVMSHCQLALAGWTGAMNGSGYGMASVNVKAYDTSEGKRRTSTTPNMQDPSVAMTLTFGYSTGAFLPLDASPATEAKVKGFAGYIWQANVVGSDGDDTGNAELEGRVTITAADCAALQMNSSSVVNETNKTGTLIVNCIGTAGTAVWFRGFELTGGQVPPEDDTNTLSNEFVEFLKDFGTLKWDVLVVGPLDLTTTNCNAINIPFTYETSITNLYAVSDGVAKSLPLVIECPNDIPVDCGQTFSYPETMIVGGCGNLTISFDPAPIPNDPPAVGNKPFTAGSHPFPVGITPVTVSVTDTNGNTTNCTFNVIVTDTNKPVVTLNGAATMTVECHATFTDPGATASDSCAGSPREVTVTGSVNTDSVGDYTLTYSATDTNSNTGTATRTVHVVDTTKPVIVATGTPANGVLGDSPTAAQIEDALGTATATDVCGVGTPTAVTSSVTVNGCSSSQTRTWNVTDDAGNPATPVSRTVTWGASLTLRGFDSPIGTQGNECGTTTVTVNKGNVIPIKFDLLCGTSALTTGIPTVKIQEYDPSCNTAGSFVSSLATYQNAWHANWDTNPTRKNFKYRISVIVNEAEVGFVWAKVK